MVARALAHTCTHIFFVAINICENFSRELLALFIADGIFSSQNSDLNQTTTDYMHIACHIITCARVCAFAAIFPNKMEAKWKTQRNWVAFIIVGLAQVNNNEKFQPSNEQRENGRMSEYQNEILMQSEHGLFNRTRERERERKKIRCNRVLPLVNTH